MMLATSPLVSVVVPTYQRPDLLERCLNALLRQTLSTDAYEIIVCDDGPSERTQAVVDAARVRCGDRPHIAYIEVRGTQGPAGARNCGWKHARAEIIAFTDDDTVPEPSWLDGGLDAMASGVQAAVGKVVMPLPEEPSDIERDAARLTQAEFVTANCFVRRDVLNELGGFDERFTQAWREDSDLQFQLLRRGYSIAPAPGAIVVHPLRPTSFAANIGMQRKVMFDVLLYRKHPDFYRQRIRRGPPWFYLAVTASLLVTAWSALAGWTSMLILAGGVWALLTAGFFAWRLAKSGKTVRNILEVFISSIAIPPLSIFWRFVGIARFGRAFP